MTAFLFVASISPRVVCPGTTRAHGLAPTGATWFDSGAVHSSTGATTFEASPAKGGCSMSAPSKDGPQRWGGYPTITQRAFR